VQNPIFGDFGGAGKPLPRRVLRMMLEIRPRRG